MLADFRKSLPHRIEIFESLDFARENDVEDWDMQMHADFSCLKCGTYNSVYAGNCVKCGNFPVNNFAVRHWNIIKDNPERNNV